MNKLILLLFALLCFSACKSTKNAVKKKSASISVKEDKNDKGAAFKIDTKEKKEVSDSELKANTIIDTALSFSGTPYKYGGTTAKGMDCSGLIYTAFRTHDISLQRTSYMMAEQGKKVELKEVKKGDLLFFNTNKNRKRINHVGLVVSVDKNDIRFIHATTSRGVLISSLKEGYWNHAYVEARTIL